MDIEFLPSKDYLVSFMEYTLNYVLNEFINRGCDLKGEGKGAALGRFE
ncbi:MAG: hypothetical protein HS132_15955 [Planctomycetia bacterium]|nr:hypothetical protein [Planctomycetia bacterium]